MMITLYSRFVGSTSMRVYHERWLLCAAGLSLWFVYALARTSAVSEDLVGDYEHLQARIDDGSLITIRISCEEDVVTSDADVLYILPPGTELLLTRASQEAIAEVAICIATEGPTKDLLVGHLLGACDLLTADHPSIQLRVIRISTEADVASGQTVLLAHTEPSKGNPPGCLV